MKHYSQPIRKLMEMNLEGPNIVAYHGTSVEAIEMLAKTGKLLGTDWKHQLDDIKVPTDYVYITPLKEKFKDCPLYEKLKEREGGQIWSSQECYAEFKAFVHYLTNNLGFLPKDASLGDLDPEGIRRVNVYKQELKKLVNEAEKHNISERNLMNILKSSWKRKGVGIGLSEKILELPIEHDPECLGESLRIPVKTGLPIKYIGAIWPISDVDKRELNKLLK